MSSLAGAPDRANDDKDDDDDDDGGDGAAGADNVVDDDVPLILMLMFSLLTLAREEGAPARPRIGDRLCSRSRPANKSCFALSAASSFAKALLCDCDCDCVCVWVGFTAGGGGGVTAPSELASRFPR